MREIEYININQDSLFKTGYNFIFLTPDNEEARLEIIEIEGNLLQSGFQIIYKPSFFFSKINKHFSQIYNSLKGYYINELPQNFQGIEIINFTNDKSQCYISKSRINGGRALSFRVMNKEIWGKYN